MKNCLMLCSVLVVFALGAGCAALPELPKAQITELKLAEATPDQSGKLVYSGQVRKVGEPDIVFTYERRVEVKESGLVSTHLTADLDGRLVVLHTAAHSADYELVHFRELHRQTGFEGTVELEGASLRFVAKSGGETEVVEEDVEGPVVVGPTLFGVLISRWNELADGGTFVMRFALLDRQETIGLEAHLEVVEGVSRVVLTPTSFLVGMVVDPLVVDFDTERRPIRYLGPVPPLHATGGTLESFVGEVHYTYHSSYR